MKNFRLISALLTAMLAMTACGEGAVTTDTTAIDTTTAVESATVAETDLYAEGYDLGGFDFTILNVPLSLWNMNTDIDFEAQTGESLDDVIYNRNRNTEEKLNFKLNVVHSSGYHDGSLNNAIRKDVVSGDAQYDAAYAYGADVGSLITDEALLNLMDLENLTLDQPWWIQTTMEQAKIGDDTCYFAHSYLSLTAFDLTWCLFFNETMMDNLNIEKPYDLVREGKWTVDALRKLAKEGAQLNGDDNWDWKDDGSAVYGFCAMHSGALAQIIGCGGLFSEKDANGLPVLAVENERFANILYTLADMYASQGEFRKGSTTDGSKDAYLTSFRGRRSMFVAGEVKSSGEFREFTDTFGMVPNPKLDENQESYYSWTNNAAPVLVVPTTSKAPETTATILDALSYYSYRDVLPVYYGNTVSQKGLRNEDSVEMLDIIRASLTFDASLCYGWTTSLAESLRDKIIAGNNDVMSTIESMKGKAEQKIQAMLDKLS